MVRCVLVIALVAAAACGSKPAPSGPSNGSGGKMDTMMMEGKGMTADEASTFGPLEVGVDWQTYTKVNKARFVSETHGGRMVDTYVNPTGLDAFKAGGELPVGAIVVKTSFDKQGGAGPIFVMEKRAAGFNPEHGDWWFAIHWAEPPDAWKQKLGGPIYWRTPSKRADYCADCHDVYDHQIGGVPDEHKAW